VKVSVVRSRPRPVPSPSSATSSAVVVYCQRCGIPLDESADLATAQRQPCPICGSVGRAPEVVHAATLAPTGHLVRKWKTGRTAKTRRVVKTGDDFTRDLKAWGTKVVDVDRKIDTYREEIILYDGTRIETSARLRDHSKIQ
jgi:hypothetical protein